MKKILLCLLSSIGMLLCDAQTFTIKAKIHNPQNYTLYLAYYIGDKFVLDTTNIQENGI